MPFRKKRAVLAAEMRRYFDDKTKSALLNLPLSALAELIDDLASLKDLVSKTDEELKAVFTARDASSEANIDNALATLKQLNDTADSVTKRLKRLFE